jgi:hypothetical protein
MLHLRARVPHGFQAARDPIMVGRLFASVRKGLRLSIVCCLSVQSPLHRVKAALGRAPIHAENARQVCRFAMLDVCREDKIGVRLTRSARDCTWARVAAGSAVQANYAHLTALLKGSTEIGSVSDGRVTPP